MVSLYNPVSVNEIVTHRNGLFFMHVTNVCDRLKSENKRQQKVYFFHCFSISQIQVKVYIVNIVVAPFLKINDSMLVS